MSAKQKVRIFLDEKIWRECQKAAIDNKTSAGAFIDSVLSERLQLGTMPTVTTFAYTKEVSTKLGEETWREMRKIAIDHGFSPHDLVNAILREKLGVQ